MRIGLNEYYFEIAINEYHIRGIVHEPCEIKETNHIVIYCYGLVGDRVDCHRLAVEAGRFFAKNNIIFVRFDCRGTGVSDGNSIDFGYYDFIKDIKQVADFFKDKYPNKEIIFLGVSEGAIAASYITQTYEFCNKRLILWSPIYRKSRRDKVSNDIVLNIETNAHTSNQKNNYISKYDNIQKTNIRGIADFGLWLSMTYLIERRRISELIELRYINSVICIYGGEDVRTVETVLEIKEYHNSDVRKIDKADHLFSHTKYKNELFHRTLDWIKY